MLEYKRPRVPSSEADDELVSAARLAKDLGVSATTATNWRKRGKVYAEKVGSTWYYSRQDLLYFLGRSTRSP